MSTWDSQIYTTVCEMASHQDLLYNTGNSDKYYVAGYMVKYFERQ